MAITWTGNSSTSWEDAGNWSPKQVPGRNAAAQDEVVIGSYAMVMIGSGKSKTLSALKLGQGARLTGGKLILDSLTLIGPFTFSGTQLVVKESLQITSQGMCWFDGGALTNEGAGLWLPDSTDPLHAKNGFAFLNSGSFDCQADQLFGIGPLPQGDIPPSLTNTGTLQKSVGTSKSCCNLWMVLANNDGNVQVIRGNLRIATPSLVDNPPTLSGLFEVGAGTTLRLNGALIFGDESTIQGSPVDGNFAAGQVQISEYSGFPGDIMISGGYNVLSTLVSGAGAIFNGTTFSEGCAINVQGNCSVTIGEVSGATVTIGVIAPS